MATWKKNLLPFVQFRWNLMFFLIQCCRRYQDFLVYWYWVNVKWYQNRCFIFYLHIWTIFNIFTFSSWMRMYWFYVKNDFRNFHQIFTFWDPLSEKMVFTKVSVRLSVCLSVWNLSEIPKIWGWLRNLNLPNLLIATPLYVNLILL